MTSIVVLTGASGSGKTTLLRSIKAMEIPSLTCFNCDTIYAELPDRVRADGELAQDAILEHWARLVLSQPAIEIAILDTQIRPQKAIGLLKRLGIGSHRVVLVECEQTEREARLRGPRGQPELVTAQMEHWAAYLRGQADALGLDIINTTATSISTSSARLQSIVDSLRLSH